MHSLLFPRSWAAGYKPMCDLSHVTMSNYGGFTCQVLGATALRTPDVGVANVLQSLSQAADKVPEPGWVTLFSGLLSQARRLPPQVFSSEAISRDPPQASLLGLPFGVEGTRGRHFSPLCLSRHFRSSCSIPSPRLPETAACLSAVR